MQDGDPRVLFAQVIEDGSGVVRAGVVNEAKVSGRTCADPFQEGARIETRLLRCSKEQRA